ncbi:MAG TPA: host attachment protein, partial [Myxococcota bacterium]
MSRTYVVVADAACARCYASTGHRQLSLLDQLEHPQGRQHGIDLVSDRAGMGGSDGGEPHAFEPHTDVRDAERERFARRIARYVDAAWASGAMHDVILVMPPRMLGEVRTALSQKAAGR